MVGRTISHYRITGQLGSGGMGVVYSAEDVRLGRPVALKFVSQDLAHDEQAVQRLRSEARAASALNHPHICTIYDIGDDDGRPFIVMELMRGQTLRERLATGHLSPQQVLDVGIEIADALHVAHSSGIVHRDIKPGNIFLTENGHVKVLDFGLAKITPLQMGTATTGHSPAATAAGVMLGTTGYMSPEQVAGEQLDGRSDLFSLGVVLYEAATGQHPFPGKTAAAVVAAILDRAPLPALAHRPDIPLRLQEAIENSLEKDRELRYQSAADLRADLRRVRRDVESSHATRAASLGAGSSAARSGSTRSSRERIAAQEVEAPEPSIHPSGNRSLIYGALALVAVVALAVFVMYRSGRVKPAEPVTPPTPATTPAPRESTDERIRVAQGAFDARNYRGALEQATAILAIAPDNETALKIRNAAQEVLALYDKAMADANRRMSIGDFEGAARALDTARGIDPASPAVIALSSRLGDAARRTASTNTVRPDPSTRARNEERSASQVPAAEPSRSLPQPPTPVPAAPQSAAVPPPPVPAAPEPIAKPPSSVESAPIAKPQPTPAPEVSRTEPPKSERSASETAKPPAAANDDAAIRQLIATYARAIEGKDLGLFRSIKPNLSREEERRLQDGFRAVTSQRVNLTIASIERSGNDTAVVVVNRKDTVQAGGRQYVTDSRQTLQLARTATGWGIVDIR